MLPKITIEFPYVKFSSSGRRSQVHRQAIRGRLAREENLRFPEGALPCIILLQKTSPSRRGPSSPIGDP